MTTKQEMPKNEIIHRFGIFHIINGRARNVHKYLF